MSTRCFSRCLAFTTFLLLFAACRQDPGTVRPDEAFTPYITAFTTGHISARSTIYVRLAEDIRLKDTSSTTVQGLFSAEPAAAGRVTWYDHRTLAFTPGERLQPDRSYTFTFALGDVAHVPSGLERFRFPVTTFRQGVQARVSDLRSTDSSDLTWQQLVVAVSTNDDATGQDLSSCFTVRQGERRLTLTWEHEPNGRYHRFVADSVRRGEEASRVLIEWNGEAVQSTDRDTLQFIVPSLNDLRLVGSEVVSNGEQYAVLLFSDPLDAQQELVGLAGIGGAEDVRLSVDGNRLLMYPAGRLSGDLQAFVSGALRNVNGRKLGQDITVDLRFEELKPAVRMTGKGVVLPSTDGLLMPFEAVNLSAVDVQVIRIHADNVAQFLQVNDLDGEREMARVGRPVNRTTVPLHTRVPADAGRWTTYYLDLEKLLRTEPGAIYRIELSFRREHSLYPCDEASTVALPEGTTEEDAEEWDDLEDHYYYEDWYYYDDYDHTERDEPCSPSYYGRRRSVSRNILASDLGILAKRGADGNMLVCVSDLRTARPLSGVKITVHDLQHRELAEVITDGEGLCTVPRGDHKAFLLKARKGEQRGYLRLDEGSALSVSEFDVRGSAVEKGLKGFLYGERGVWRPGDSLYLAFMLQDDQHTLPPSHPVVMELSDPRGRVDQKLVRSNPVNGVYDLRCATRPDAPTGVWHAKVTVGGASFHRSIRIETIKPNRLKVTLDPGGEKLTRSTRGDATLHAAWLHGAPARGLKARVNLTLTAAAPSFKGHEKYHFSDLRTDVGGEERLVFDGVLDGKGDARFPLRIDLNALAPPVVTANLVTRVFEAGGDASMDRTQVSYYPYDSYVGIRAPESRSPWGTYVTDTTWTFQAVSLDADGKPKAGHALKAQIYQLSYSWWWDGELDGANSYVTSPSVELREVQDLVTDARGRATVRFRVNKPDWGRFAVRLVDPASGHTAALQVYMDWPGWEGRSRREAPDQAAMLTFTCDKDRYAVGDMAELVIPSSGSGRALVSLETGSRVLDASWIDLREKETRHRIAITQDMAPTVYAHVTVVQPHANTSNDRPIRLYGVIPLNVEDAATHLSPTLSSPAEVRTDVPFKVTVAEKEGRAMTYTLAIVDEGLLDLTRFKTPDPWAQFYAREALGVHTWDMYDHVIGAFGRQVERVLALGGSDEAAPPDGSRAQRFKPVVRFIGPFTLKPGARADHSFTLTNYVGSVRMMVVASDGDRAYGNAERTVPVRKPLMVLTTLPRVVGPGETLDVPVTVFAMDPKVKDVKVTLTAQGPVSLVEKGTRQVRFTATGDQVVPFRIRVGEAVGTARLTVVAESGVERATETLEIGVRQPVLPLTVAEEHVLDAGGQWEGTPKPLGVTGTNEAYLELSTVPPVDLGRRLRYLVDYPHGCVEQTTSKCFPQLFLEDVMELDDRTVLRMRRNVEAGIQRLKGFQRADGAFNYWPGWDQYDGWSTVYVGHFLLEAQRKGHAVPSGMLERWTSFSRRAAREWNVSAAEGWSRGASQLLQAYRLYVLALTGVPELGAMNRLRTMTATDPQVTWTLAAAYAASGRRDVSDRMIQHLGTEVRPYTEQGHTYGCDLRDEAIVALALQASGDKARAAGVVQRLARRLSSGDWYSTQATAFALMAVARITEGSGPGKGLAYRIERNDKGSDRASAKAFVREELPTPDGSAHIRVQNRGTGPLYVRLVRSGSPMPGEEGAYSNGLSLSVSYQLADGSPISAASIEQGTDLTATVTITNPGSAGHLQQLALTQVFPSGWEVRNARMEGTDAAQRESAYSYRDIRDDRVMTYLDLPRGRTVRYNVQLNAAYVGRFYLPAPSCEAMYDHSIGAREAGRWVEVVPVGSQATAMP